MTAENKKEIRYYAEKDGSQPVKEWINALKKKKFVEATKIQSRINRAGKGNFGNHRFLGGNFFELKIDYGPGYRIYIGKDGDTLLLILHGGTKSSQQADINEARNRWELYQTEKKKILSEKGVKNE